MARLSQARDDSGSLFNKSVDRVIHRSLRYAQARIFFSFDKHDAGTNNFVPKLSRGVSRRAFVLRLSSASRDENLRENEKNETTGILSLYAHERTITRA